MVAARGTAAEISTLGSDDDQSFSIRVDRRY